MNETSTSTTSGLDAVYHRAAHGVTIDAGLSKKQFLAGTNPLRVIRGISRRLLRHAGLVPEPLLKLRRGRSDDSEQHVGVLRAAELGTLAEK